MFLIVKVLSAELWGDHCRRIGVEFEASTGYVVNPRAT